MITGKAMIGGEKYHSRHLKANDYYEKNKEVQGIWAGSACEVYGVSAGSVVLEDEFEALRQNLHAVSGKQITQRQNTTRVNKDGTEVANRRAFYDFTISAPKSFSVLGVTYGFEQAVEWHNTAVNKAIKEMEYWISRQDHDDKRGPVERTGRFAAACFKHDANRSLEPNLHDHIVIFNMTPSENKNSYAIESNELFQRTKYFTSIYRDALAHEAIKAGAIIEIDDKGAPQIRNKAASLKEVCKHFSERTKNKEWLVKHCESFIGSKLTNNEVTVIVRASRGFKEEIFSELINDYSFTGSRENIIKEFSLLVSKCSDGGMIETTTEEVINQQKRSLSAEQNSLIMNVINDIDGNIKESELIPSIKSGIKHGIEDRFERKSVIYDYELYEAALKHTCGLGTDIEGLRGTVDSYCESPSNKLIQLGNEITTIEHLKQELDIINWTQESQNQSTVEIEGFKPSKTLNNQQQKAVNTIISSKGSLSILVGRAGTGKTFTTSEIVRANIENGHLVYMLAPSNGARDVLISDGEKLKTEYKQPETALPFLQAKSLQLFLANVSLQESIPKNSLVTLDEAGLASIAQVHQLFKIARSNAWRILLVGDPKQHTSVDAGDALRIILRNTSAPRSRLEIIQRQQNMEYREIAQSLADGETNNAFLMMDQIGAISEHKGSSYVQTLAKTFLSHYDPSDSKSAILVTPTHDEIDDVSLEIRKILKKQGLLGPEKTIDTIRDLSWTYAHKKDYRNYTSDHVIFINIGPNRGQSFNVQGIERGMGIKCISSKDETVYFTRSDVKTFSVCKKHPLRLSPGDKIMNRVGCKTKNGQAINGERLTFTGIDSTGKIQTKEGKTLTHNLISYAYASTSHKSQGSTYKNVILGFNRESIGEVSKKLAYVAGTRGQKNIHLIVENKTELKQIEAKTGDRKFAYDLITGQQAEKKTAKEKTAKEKTAEKRSSDITKSLKQAKKGRVHATHGSRNTNNMVRGIRMSP